MEKPKLETCHWQTTAVCEIKPDKRPPMPSQDMWLLLNSTWYLPGPLSVSPTYTTLQSTALSCPSLEGTEHYGLTSYTTVSAFCKRCEGERPSAVSLGSMRKKGLVWAQLSTGRALVLKRPHCDGRGSSGGVTFLGARILLPCQQPG